MIIQTKYFGEMDIDESAVINFSDGLPGFLNLHKFALIVDSDGAFFWLQSTDDSKVAFILVDVSLYDPTYSPLIDEAYLEGLGEYSPETFAVLNIANPQDNIEDTTVNLRAPIIINTELRLGRQIICTNDEYTIRHKLFDKANTEGV